MAPPLASFWDLPIESNSLQDPCLAGWLLMRSYLFVEDGETVWWFFLLPFLLLKAVMCGHHAPTDGAVRAPETVLRTNLGEHLYPIKGWECGFRHAFGRTKKLM